MDNYNKTIKILYVEDEDDVREGYSRALRRVTESLFSAENGLIGLELYKEHKPDIVISDIKMPIMDGIEMTKAIKKIDEDANIVFTTAHSESAYLLEAIELHADSYLLKPVQKKSIISVVEKLTKRILLERENEELKKELSKMAYTDNLTKVYNRHKFEEIFRYELTQIKRHDYPLSIAILDIDLFKKFNDKYGHIIGDEILVMLADTMQKNIRETDVFARWGGEEFVLLFNNANLENAVKLANNFRKIIQNTQHSSAGNVTASFGLTEYKKGDTLESMLKRADIALYEAKENGRNCVRSMI
jgi:diguanylate cyclase (GGDEF)-like protein